MKEIERKYGKNIAGDQYFQDINHNEKSQTSCPWTNATYDRLREELFYDALQLQKAFILNSKSVRQNLNCLGRMWGNEYGLEDKKAGYASLFNTLFLVVPVLSTTFASVGSLLRNIGQGQLGTLIIDESGQATPQSALGALWRTRKAIVVGDPLQVEPVVTSSKELAKLFGNKLMISPLYLRREISVQEMADQLNPFGGYIDKLWVGCPLIVHRRCIAPMFDIANQIAYDNRMFNQTKEPNDLKVLLKESCWINVQGKEIGDKNHFVKEQSDVVEALIKRACLLNNGLPEIYIISPFTTVVIGLKKALTAMLKNQFPEKEIAEWLKKSCGTVHTFQGKEAKEVLFVLGCDKASGIGAAQWAGRKPNILNVAVTRAKYRLAIIGDGDFWCKIRNFDVAYEKLPKINSEAVYYDLAECSEPATL